MLTVIGHVKNRLYSLTRIAIFFLFVLFFPKMFLYLHSNERKIPLYTKSSTLKLGVENIDSFLSAFNIKNKKNANIGLITNQTGKDQSGQRTLDILIKKGFNVLKVFAPEHGINGNLQASQDVQDGTDKQTNIPIVSLYKNGSVKNALSPSVLKGIDILVFDMQDAGVRHYTYISVLYNILKIGAQHNKRVIVLDRPNLLGPNIEGCLVEQDFISGISCASIPMRYGMTIGELALFFNKNRLKKKADLHIVKMKSYDRFNHYQSGLLTYLSPNIKTIQSCYGYSFLGALGEIRPFDLAVGTDNAFQCILLDDTIEFSKKKWHELHEILKSKSINNSFYRYYSKRKKKYYSGLKITIDDINQVNSFSLFLTIVTFFKKNKIDITFSPYFNLALGTDKVKNFLNGKISKKALKKYVNKGLFSFYKQASDCFLYTPRPQVVRL